MNKKYVYSSSLAPYIEGLIGQKRADGYIYEYEAYILKTFDNFTNMYEDKDFYNEIKHFCM